jgi:hypothetical protein
MSGAVYQRVLNQLTGLIKQLGITRLFSSDKGISYVFAGISA